MPSTMARALPAGTIKTSPAPLEDIGEDEDEVLDAVEDEVSLAAEPLLVAVADELPDELDLPLAVAETVEEVEEPNLNISFQRPPQDLFECVCRLP
ncbi:MAG: hypothetical protein M1822_003523 [Bathelium mastoideum]|nr:MAG: hypothetical protein M1822_003523 [Bathelium mastoideum]